MLAAKKSLLRPIKNNIKIHNQGSVAWPLENDKLACVALAKRPFYTFIFPPEPIPLQCGSSTKGPGLRGFGSSGKKRSESFQITSESVCLLLSSRKSVSQWCEWHLIQPHVCCSHSQVSSGYSLAWCCTCLHLSRHCCNNREQGPRK